MTRYNDSDQSVLESLSAMFDDEANEQDLQNLLEQDPAELNKRMEAFHLIKNTLRKDSEVEIEAHYNLADRVRAQLSEERAIDPAKQQVVALFSAHSQKVKPNRRITSIWTGFAVAASVAFMVVLGGNVLLKPAINEPSVAETSNNDVSKLPVTSLAELKKQPIDVDSLRLKSYLRQHAEQATMTVGQGMIPMARIVSYPVEE